MTTTKYDPFRPFSDLDRLFGSVTRSPASLAMPMDLFRQGEQFVARIDLPGVDPETIDIDVEDRTLTVRAQRHTETDGDAQWLTHERPSGTFARQLTLGYGVALTEIEAQYSDGVLTLTIPVAEEAKPRKISVAHGASTKTITGSVSDKPEKGHKSDDKSAKETAATAK